MKIKRFVAADMRQAMRDVREDQGPEAVILSTRRLDEGIEIIAAVDYDEALVREAARHGSPLLDNVTTAAEVKTLAPAAETPAPSRLWRRSAAAPAAVEAPKKKAEPAEPAAEPVDAVRISATAMAASRAKVPAAILSAASTALPVDAAQPVIAQIPLTQPAVNQPAPGLSAEPPLHPMIERAAQETARMRAELGSMREMLELQLSSLAWNDMERRQPLRARVLREMTRLGIDADVARQLADELPQQISPEQARYLPLGMISRNLRITDRESLEHGGVTALVGPTGVGKTTTIAKLAARAVVRHGVGQVALVSTDHYRIGAAAQLEHYGRLLGVRVYPADDAQSLRQVLQMLHGKHTVLVDTAGVSGSDPRLEQQMDILNDVAHGGDAELRSCIVLAANAQSQALEESMRAYLPLNPDGCILTKLDEAPNLGGALSVLMRHRLSLDYTTDGQRVPEDIAAADARVLVLRAAHALKGSGSIVDDGTMADRFGLAVATA
jgi:flagellar biosynthesis protein FlhF